MKRIIHMSDLHVGYEDFGDRFRSITDNLIFEKGNKACEYVLVITGDLVDNAHNAESYPEVKAALDTLRNAGFEHILVVPGNHDYGTGSHGDKKFVTLFQQAFYGDKRGFPRKDIIDGITFIGLDSMTEELNWYDELWAEGELGDQQLRRLKAILRDDDVRLCKKRVVYLHHHPFQWRPLHKLKDSRKLKEVLVEAQGQGVSIDAVLFGHNHEGKVHNGQWGIPRCYDAGTATLKPRPKYLNWCPWFKVRSSTRVINIEKEEVYLDYELPLL